MSLKGKLASRPHGIKDTVFYLQGNIASFNVPPRFHISQNFVNDHYIGYFMGIIPHIKHWEESSEWEGRERSEII